jgi:ElaA protein
MWRLSTFDQLSARDLYDLAYARIQTFVVEQNRVYQEIDETDLRALHLFAYEQEKILACARIFPDNGHVSFGRVLVVPERRRQGHGQRLMARILAVLAERHLESVVEIEAQIQTRGFYERFGFHVEGSVFTFNHTPHVRMRHAPLGPRPEPG